MTPTTSARVTAACALSASGLEVTDLSEGR